jgi:hypothetical protein
MSSERNPRPFLMHFITVVVLPVSGGADSKREFWSLVAMQAECKSTWPFDIIRNLNMGSTKLTYRTCRDLAISALTVTTIGEEKSIEN